MSYWGAVAGYKFLLDLAVQAGATTLEVSRAQGNLRLVTPEQLATV